MLEQASELTRLYLHCTKCFRKIGFIILFNDKTLFIENVKVDFPKQPKIVCEKCQRSGDGGKRPPKL